MNTETMLTLQDTSLTPYAKEDIKKLMDQCKCQDMQDAKFWLLLQDIMKTKQTFQWKMNLLQWVCEGLFALEQGADQLALYEAFRMANETECMTKVIEGQYWMNKVYHTTSNAAATSDTTNRRSIALDPLDLIRYGNPRGYLTTLLTSAGGWYEMKERRDPIFGWQISCHGSFINTIYNFTAIASDPDKRIATQEALQRAILHCDQYLLGKHIQFKSMAPNPIPGAQEWPTYQSIYDISRKQWKVTCQCIYVYEQNLIPIHTHAYHCDREVATILSTQSALVQCTNIVKCKGLL